MSSSDLQDAARPIPTRLPFVRPPTDGRLHREGLEASYLGDSIGRWEGDTLVVDAVNFTDDTWLGIDGYFHSAKLRVIEEPPCIEKDSDHLVNLDHN